MNAHILLAAAPPARGTPLSDLIPASIVAAALVLLVVALSVAHRRGTISILSRLGAVSEKESGLPGWAGVPIAFATTSLLIAVFGFYWDVSWHIDRGRDPGAFANPAHWFIIVGLAGIAFAGVLAVVMGDDRVGPAAIRITDNWRAPVSGVLLTVCGVIALAGFPLDDIWHRLFGQDVTLWGPTHIQMVGGASLATLALWALIVEGKRAAVGQPTSSLMHGIVNGRDIAVGGAFLLGLSTLQGEFDFGVPQFRQLYHPVLIMLAASIALVAVRIRFGRGGALGAVAFFLAIRGGLTLLIGPVLGRTILHFPLYLPEALIVEAVAWRVGRDRQLTLAVWSGLGIGTVGLAAEWAWSHVWMPLPWHASLLPQGAVVGFLAAMAGAVIGGFVGRALAPPEIARQRGPSWVGVAAGIVALACIAIPMPMSAAHGARADVTVSQAASSEPGRHVRVRVHLTPANAADHANWFNVTAWQGARHGDGGLVIAPLHRVAAGEYSTGEPIPVSGNWKAILRLQKGTQVASLPFFMPADAAIPAAEVPAPPQFSRAFVADKTVLQREARGGSVALQRVAYAILSVLAICWIAVLGWGLRRLETHDDSAPDDDRGQRRPLGRPAYA